MHFLSPHYLSALLAIILIDLVLAGDNAIVIAMAARRLPKELQRKAIIWGTVGAIGVRTAMTLVVVYLLRIPGLMFLGGLILFPIAWKLLREDDLDQPHISKITGFWTAMRTIVIADALMGLDNVLAVAGASKNHMSLVVTGLLVSIPLVVWGSTLILKMMGRFPWIIYLGAGAIAWTAARMITHGYGLKGWFDQHDALRWVVDIFAILAICGGSWWMEQRAKRKAGH
ncbi:TerC family protein [Oleiagrimonas sp.]|jgi:YjbE family integral membrane protein|uniref:TerC family protein n=1 Tax=Oleiagrimonas sp. TaxID=2010330 RepID=UPI0026193A46|nr:TerC family protein [Oleiagrimonas sp.]MDA3914668.1 TerC family protein [Oleiagrimonas sp.]